MPAHTLNLGVMIAHVLYKYILNKLIIRPLAGSTISQLLRLLIIYEYDSPKLITRSIGCKIL